MCSTALMETIEYYVTIKTAVYVLLIDASKAFDCVSHIKLFNTLQAHGACPLIIWVLYNMFTNSDIQVRWKSKLSNVFPLMHGVKQGGCLSPMLFMLYLDGLIQKLKHSDIGWHIGRTYCGVFGYANDLAIVSPTLFGLRYMIEICKEYASEIDLLFNPKKSKLLSLVNSVMYLGDKLYNNIYKTKIDELVCDFERRSNHIIHNFSMCDSFTLKHIFSTYCESFYGCELLTLRILICQNCIFHGGKLYVILFNCLIELINYIVSNLGNSIIGRIDRRLCKYIYTIYCIMRILLNSKLSPTSIFSDNYIYLCNKYNIAHSGTDTEICHLLQI